MAGILVCKQNVICKQTRSTIYYPLNFFILFVMLLDRVWRLIDRDPTRVRVAGNLTVWNTYHDVGHGFRYNNFNVWLRNTGGGRCESHLFDLYFGVNTPI